MLVEVTRASGDNFEIGYSEKRYDMFFEEEREVNLVDVDSWDELNELIEETYIVQKSGYKFDGHHTPSKFEGIDNKVTIYDGRIE